MFHFQSDSKVAQEKLKLDNEKLTVENQRLKLRVNTLIRKLQKARTERQNYRKSSIRFQRIVNEQKEGEHLPKRTKHKIVKNVLEGKMSPVQLDCMLNNKGSHQWSNEDYRFATEIATRDKTCFNLIRKVCISDIKFW